MSPIGSTLRDIGKCSPTLEEVRERPECATHVARRRKSGLVEDASHLPQVDRLLDLMHGSRLDQLEAAFRALGLRLGVKIEKAA
jgi:antitoxin HicB